MNTEIENSCLLDVIQELIDVAEKLTEFDTVLMLEQVKENKKYFADNFTPSNENINKDTVTTPISEDTIVTIMEEILSISEVCKKRMIEIMDKNVIKKEK